MGGLFAAGQHAEQGQADKGLDAKGAMAGEDSGGHRARQFMSRGNAYTLGQLRARMRKDSGEPKPLHGLVKSAIMGKLARCSVVWRFTGFFMDWSV